jgi:hypothetical protein
MVLGKTTDELHRRQVSSILLLLEFYLYTKLVYISFDAKLDCYLYYYYYY